MTGICSAVSEAATMSSAGRPTHARGRGQVATDFPTLNPLQAKIQSAATTNPFNAFVTKFNAAGSGLMYSTYLGGSTQDQANGITLDSADEVCVAGLTLSSDFPLVDPLQNANSGTGDGAADAFVSVLNATGSGLVFSTYLGGSGSASAAKRGQMDSANAIAVDSMGDLYVTGVTYSTDFPTAAAFQNTNRASSGGTAFVTKIDSIQDPPPPSGGGGALGWDALGILSGAAGLRCQKRRDC
jgi:Beta-propeller repeat